MYGWRHFQPSLTNCPKLSASHASPVMGLQAVVLQLEYWVPPFWEFPVDRVFFFTVLVLMRLERDFRRL